MRKHVFLLGLFSLFLSFISFGQTVFINEIHYDNVGTDQGEAVEIAGPTGTDLTGWSLELYNGSNGTFYNSILLAGTLDDSGNGLGIRVLTFPSNGIQNGSPDGIALVNADGEVIEFLSYEGVMTATNGLASGQESTDIGVREGSTTPIGTSLQRIGSGSEGSDFTWQESAAESFGTINLGQTYVPAVAQLRINEIDVDTPGRDTAEFVELYDGGVGNTSLDGFILVGYNGNGDLSYRTIDLAGFATNDEGYFVIGNEGVTNVGLVVPSNTFQNGADALALYERPAADFPNGTALTTEGLVDAIVYDTSDADDTELLVLLNDGQLQVNEDENGEKDTESLQRIPNGSGGLQNTDSYQAAEPTPGTTNGEGTTNPPPPTDIISIQQARDAAENATVTITGTLTVSDQFAGSAYLQDSTGAIAIFDEQVYGTGNFSVGDSITVTGIRASFNDQVQLSGLTSVVANGVANTPIVPRAITVAELDQFPAQLVQITTTTFENGILLFGNSNYTVTDASGEGQVRIDNDVDGLVGASVPTDCGSVIGVVGRFRDFFQLLPRQTSDLPCAMPFMQPDTGSEIPEEISLDVVTWNIEWFGDESNSPAAGSPMSDEIQRDSVRTALLELNADVIAVQEIADDTLFAQLVSSLPGYEYRLSEFVSAPGGSGTKQKVGFIYKTEVIEPLQFRPLLATIHPLYNGGDDSAISDYPQGATDRFYASGRLPYLMTATFTSNGVEEEIDFIALHARANNRNNAQERYDFRKFDVEVLKDSLDAQFADRKVIILGDFNDDVDETVADISSTVTSYDAYVQDSINYDIVSRSLSDQKLRSFVFTDNMIDHVMITDELFESYLDNSSQVGYQLYDNDYATTTSDHLPVSARFVFRTIEPTSPLSVNITGDTLVYTGYRKNLECTRLAAETEGGEAPYTYVWSTGATTPELKVCPKETTQYSVTVTDSRGAAVTQLITVRVEDVSCGSSWFPRVQVCYEGRDRCVPQYIAEYLISRGASLGSCSSDNGVDPLTVSVFPIPPIFRNYTTIYLRSNRDISGTLQIFNFQGQSVWEQEVNLKEGKNTQNLDLVSLKGGCYFVVFQTENYRSRVQKVIKY